MSLSSEQMMKLMAYADGELDGAERDEVEKVLASDADAARFVEQIAGLGEIVACGHEARSGQAVASFDVAEAVMAAIAGARQQSAPAKVVPLARARDRRSGLKIGVSVAAALALAASVFVVAQHRADEVPMAKGPSAAGTPTAVAVALNSGGPGVEVTTVESAENSVSVFYLPTANELSTSVVVWVEESGEK